MLITTSVLDIGVSINDGDLGNLVIATESKVSFLQMIGRVRNENCAACNLYLYPRNAKYYRRRVEQYEEKLQNFKELSVVPLETREYQCLAFGWYGQDEYAEFLRNAVVLTKDLWEFYGTKSTYVALKRGEITLAINEFAREKAGNLLLAEKMFYRLALDSPQKVAEKQISWIGKSTDELQIVDSVYLDRKKTELINQLLQIKNFNNEELQKQKEILSKNYRKSFFCEIVTKNGSFSTVKLDLICKKFGLKLTQKAGEDKRQMYTVEQETYSGG